jgi:tetratricopeptide (TPR) repeat protein
MGFVQAQGRKHDEAIKSLQQAIVLDRSFADAYALLGGIHTYTGQPARSIELVRTALRLNSDAGYLYFLVLGRALLFQNDPEQALIHLRAALLRNPADVETRSSPRPRSLPRATTPARNGKPTRSARWSLHSRRVAGSTAIR